MDYARFTLLLLFGSGLTVAKADPIFAPGDRISGGQLQAGVFEIGAVGLAQGGNNWPTSEGPEHAIDGVGQKYLNFGEFNTGVVVTPASGASLATSLTLWVANDAIPRDPATYKLYGTNTILGEGPFAFEDFTFISAGRISLPDSRNMGGNSPLLESNSVTTPFENDKVYSSYLILFPTVKDAPNANSMQIAEIQLDGLTGQPAPPARTQFSTTVSLASGPFASQFTVGEPVLVSYALDADAVDTDGTPDTGRFPSATQSLRFEFPNSGIVIHSSGGSVTVFNDTGNPDDQISISATSGDSSLGGEVVDFAELGFSGTTAMLPDGSLPPSRLSGLTTIGLSLCTASGFTQLAFGSGVTYAPFEPLTFELVYSGTSGASATGSITFDSSVFPPSGDLINTATLVAGVVDFELTVTGADSGNGTFDLTDVTRWIWFPGEDPVDLGRDLVGQISDFNLGVSGNSPTAPRGVQANAFRTAGGVGDVLTLVSMAPVRAAPHHWDYETLVDGPVTSWLDSNYCLPAELPLPENGDPTKDVDGVFFDGDDALTVSFEDNPLVGLTSWSATVVFRADGSLGEGGATAGLGRPNEPSRWWANAGLVGLELPAEGPASGTDWMIGLNAEHEAVFGSGDSSPQGFLNDGVALNDGFEHVLTGVFSQSTGSRQLYLDGVQVVDQVTTINRGPGETINFGCNILSVEFDRAYYTGRITQVVLHDYALTAPEALALQTQLVQVGTLVDIEFDASDNMVTLFFAGLDPSKPYHVVEVESADGVNVTRTALPGTQFTPLGASGSVTFSSEGAVRPNPVFQIVRGPLP